MSTSVYFVTSLRVWTWNIWMWLCKYGLQQTEYFLENRFNLMANWLAVSVCQNARALTSNRPVFCTLIKHVLFVWDRVGCQVILVWSVKSGCLDTDLGFCHCFWSITGFVIFFFLLTSKWKIFYSVTLIVFFCALC